MIVMENNLLQNNKTNKLAISYNKNEKLKMFLTKNFNLWNNMMWAFSNGQKISIILLINLKNKFNGIFKFDKNEIIWF